MSLGVEPVEESDEQTSNVGHEPEPASDDSARVTPGADKPTYPSEQHRRQGFIR